MKPENNGLRDLSKTPLLLTLLCINFDESMTFPPRRIEIYEEALNALMKKWDTSRSIKRDEVYRRLSLGRKKQLLARIAAKTFQEGIIFMKQKYLEDQILEYMNTLPPSDISEEVDGEIILKSLEAQHGILVERSYNIYSFSHLTFHEYFTAEYITSHSSKQVFTAVADKINDVRWHEVVLLTSSLVDQENGDILFKELFQKIQLIEHSGYGLWHLLDIFDAYQANLTLFDHATVRTIYMFLHLSQEFTSILSRSIISAYDNDTIDFVVNTLFQSSNVNEAIKEIKSYGDGSFYSIVLEKEHAEYFLNIATISLQILALLNTSLSKFFQIPSFQQFNDILLEEMDDVIYYIKRVTDVLSETYLRAVSEVLVQTVTEELNEIDILSHTITSILSEAKMRVFDLNNFVDETIIRISDHIIEHTNNILPINLSEIYKKEHIIIVLNWIYIITDILSVFFDYSPSLLSNKKISHLLERLTNFITENLHFLVDDDDMLQLYLASFTRENFSSTLNEIKKTSVNLIRHGISPDYSQESLKEYLNANLVLLECLQVASISDRIQVYEKICKSTLLF